MIGENICTHMSNRGVEQHKFLTKKGYYLFNFLTKNGKNKEKLQRNYRKVHQNVGLIFSSNEKRIVTKSESFELFDTLLLLYVSTIQLEAE